MLMTIPAKYTLTEAHFIIIELEKKIEELEKVIEKERNRPSWPSGYDADNPAGSIGMP